MSSLPSSTNIHGGVVNPANDLNLSDIESKLKSFIDRQRELLQLEQNAEIERTSLLLSNCSPKLLEQKGLALLGLGIASVGIGLGGKTLVELDRPSAYHTSPIFPPHTFRNGDLARIEAHISSSTASSAPKKSKAKASSAPTSSTSGDVSSSAVEGVVYKVSDTRIVVAVDPDAPGNSNVDDLPDRCRVVKLANSVTYDRMDKAIDRLEKTVLPSASGGSSNYTLTPLMQVLLGMKSLARPNPNQTKDITFFNPNLNESQKEALRFCLNAPEVACIHGPPGTGKTHTLIELIRQLTKPTPTHPNGQRLLVCGASNLAVDNILERLLDIDDAWPGIDAPGIAEAGEKGGSGKKASDRKLKVTRIGHPARIMAHPGILESTLEVKSTRTEQAALVKDIKQELDGILGTLSGKGSSKGSGGGGGGSKGGPKGSAAGAKDKPVGTQRASKPGARPRGAERKKMWDEVKALRKEFRTRESSIVTSVLSHDSQVVLSTCHSAGGRQLNNLPDFDVVIVDEATQAMEAVTWIPIFKAKKLILAGDPMQLPPTVLSLGDERKKLENKNKLKAKEAKGSTKQEEKKGSPVPEENQKDEDGKEGEESDEADDDEMEDEGSEVEEVAGEQKPPANSTNVKNGNQPKQTNKSTKPRRSPELVPPHSLEVTLFERLEKMYGRNVKRMLTVQYRMHKQICDFPSRTLYRSKLRSHSSVEAHLLKDLSPDASEEDSEEMLQHPVVFFDTSGCEFFERLESDSGPSDASTPITGKLRSRLDEGSRCNENEAGIVKTWVDKLVSAGIEPGQIAVITPYQAQVTLLTSLLRPIYGQSLEIGTVDGMQGREKEAVVISLVRSNDKREVGFLKEKRRMNVAMTRAKRHLCVVGDSSTVVHGGAYLKKWVAWLEANADIRFPDM